MSRTTTKDTGRFLLGLAVIFILAIVIIHLRYSSVPTPPSNPAPQPTTQPDTGTALADELPCLNDRSRRLYLWHQELARRGRLWERFRAALRMLENTPANPYGIQPDFYRDAMIGSGLSWTYAETTKDRAKAEYCCILYYHRYANRAMANLEFWVLAALHRKGAGWRRFKSAEDYADRCVNLMALGG